MPDEEPSQKEISLRYKDHVDYASKAHPWRRTRFWVSFIAIVGGTATIVWSQKRVPETFFNTGPISSHHAAFAEDCAQCHDPALMTGGPLTPARVAQVLNDRFHNGVPFEPIDRKCETCHQQHTFHEPNVVENRSCSACHIEHQGPGPMKPVVSVDCAACHNNAGVMMASAQKGMQLPPNSFRLNPKVAGFTGPDRAVLQLPRPQQGYTQVFASFERGHPEFQVLTQQVRDPNVLRFNHQRHFGADIPAINGRRLDCNYCHKPWPDGRYMQRITYEANCQACHSLQLDPRNPELVLPHGDPVAVRGFLRALPSQYEALALKKGFTNPDLVRRFVTTQMTQLRERVRSGEDFERQIFFTTNPYQPQPGANAPRGSAFHGCAYCHEVKPTPAGVPAVTKPVMIDRWMPHAHFNHAKHSQIDCASCHNATASRDTAEVLMPAKANCVTCHSAAGKVVSECSTCHTYHAPPPVTAAAQSAAGSFKQMLLGGSR